MTSSYKAKTNNLLTLSLESLSSEFDQNLGGENVINKLEEISKEFYSISYNFDICFSPKNSQIGSNNKIDGLRNSKTNLLCHLQNLFKNAITLSSSLVDENSNLKRILLKRENDIKYIQRENEEFSEYMYKYENLNSEMDNLREENGKLLKCKIIFQDNEDKLKKKLQENMRKIEELENSLKVSEIEREEVFSRNEILETKLEEETKRLYNIKAMLREREKENRNLKRKNEDLNEKIETLATLMERDSVRSEAESEANQKKFNKAENTQNKESTTDYNTNYKRDNNYTSCLSNLFPELNETEETHSESVNLEITPIQVVRRMSKNKETIISDSNCTNYSTNNSSCLKYSPEINKQNDIYKDFFLLTFQSFKLNTEDLEPYLGVNPESLYQQIQQNNIPFHKFSEFIASLFEKKRKGPNFLEKFSDIFIK